MRSPLFFLENGPWQQAISYPLYSIASVDAWCFSFKIFCIYSLTLDCGVFSLCIILSFPMLVTAPCFQIVTIMRTLYQKCKLVHGDLSEYNILYFEVTKLLSGKLFLITFHFWSQLVLILIQHPNLPIVQGHLYIIDVSQSVDLDHPSALDFLKEDCLHVSVSGS